MKITLFACLLFTTLLYGQCPPGDVTFNSQADVDNFVATYPNCDTISGYLNITGSVNDLSALDYLLYIDGALFIYQSQLTTISNFNSLIEVPVGVQVVDNNLLTEIIGFDGLNITMQVYIQNNFSLVTIDGFNNLPSVDGDFWISGNTSLQTITGFSNLTSVYSFLGINDSPLLTSIPSFNNLTFIGWSIQFFNTGLTNISGFDSLSLIGDFDPTSGFVISNNLNLVSISGFNCLETIIYDVLIQDNPLLESISGLCSLENVGQFFTIRNNDSLTTLNGIQSLISVSSAGYEGTVTLDIHNNPQLTDCNALCNLLSSNGIIGLTNIVNNQSGCDSESEINTTNCTPFEVLDCTNLINPVDGAVGVAVGTNISWNPVTGATSYLVSIGTTSEGTQIANNLNVGNITTYNLPSDLPENTEIFVKVKSINDSGQAKCCAEESFTTASVTSVDCTSLIAPVNNETDVLSTSNLTWNAVTNATGYFISIGTTSGGTDIANNIDVGNVTTFNPGVLPQGAQVFVTIIPYNVSGEASGCAQESFTTQSMVTLECATLSAPLNNETDVLVASNIIWNAVTNATGYFITIGTTSGGTDIANNIDVGNVTTYNPSVNFPESTQLFVTIIPYNTLAQASGCIEQSFTTEAFTLLPNCTSLLSPINGAQEVSVASDILWNAAINATGYIINIGTAPGATNIIDSQDIGAVTQINLPLDFPEGTEIYVTIIPYNNDGEALTCSEESFTTESFITENIAITIPKYFTPNNDGIHDEWKIEDPQNKINRLYIFDRFGKLLTSIENDQLVWYGTFNNQLLPSNDYWYSIQLHSGRKISGHFTLKR